MANYKLIGQRITGQLLLLDEDKCLYVKSRTGVGNEVNILRLKKFHSCEMRFAFAVNVLSVPRT